MFRTISFNPFVFFTPGFLLLILLLYPSSAYALQTHGGPEGLYVHQGAHLFFIVSMIIFALRINKSKLYRKKSWRSLAIGSWILAFWNLWAFTGHLVAITIPPDHIINPGSPYIPYLKVESWRDVTFFVLKMDHLISVPALFFIYMGIRKMSDDSNKNNQTGQRTDL